jgi:oligopeptide/dipeptide ABC transporter ATP-binding protein
MTLLDVKDLSISFHKQGRRTQAVSKASFTLAQGETLGIVGESGSGKSVLCYSLLGLLPMPPASIDAGSALFDGIDLLTLDPAGLRRLRGNRIGFVFQDPMTSLNPCMTVGQQLMEPLKWHHKTGHKQAEQKAIQAMQEVGLQQPELLMRSYPHQLSGGMRQRVMIAMALINDPEILIADEPTTALDVTVQAQILALIRTIQRTRNLAVIFVSHDLGVIGQIADRVLVMQSGQIVESGETSRLLQHPQHPYTARLLASIPTGSKPDRYNGDLRTQANAILRINHLGIRFVTRHRTVDAVNDVSLTVYKGETLGLVGESGSGKTSLGRAIIRLLHINEGNICLDNHDLAVMTADQLRRIRPQIQMIFQDPYASLNPRLTVFDTLAEALRIRQSLTDEAVMAAVLSLIEDVGLEAAHLYKYPHEFSGGQRQRIAIARALALKPQVIIADEPVSALDVTIQAQILRLLQSLSRQHGLTMIFISHDLGVIRMIADRTAVMYRGTIVELEDTEQLFNHPSHPYTQALLSAIPAPLHPATG